MLSDKPNVILVAYLLGPGEEYAERFLRWHESYSEHRPGMTHELLIVCKDGCLIPPLTLQNHARKLHIVHHPNYGRDIGSLLQVCSDFADYPQVLWFNSDCRILHDDYLALMYNWSRYADIGAVATTGSYEAGISRKTPNPHLRTSCLMVKPRVINSLTFGPMDTKADRYEFEHGENSLYNQLKARGLGGVVAGADGQDFLEQHWQSSATYRWHQQKNLLVADKQTDLYAAADPEGQVELELMAGWTHD